MCFVIGKMKILANKEDITETAFLLLAVIHQIVMLLPAQVECKVIEDFKKEQLDKCQSAEQAV